MNNLDATTVINTLKRYWHIDDLLLVAEYRRSEKNPRFGFFSNLSANDRKVKYPPTEGQKYDFHVIIHLPHNENLTSGQHYAVRVKPATKNTSDNPYLIELEEVLEIEGYDTPRNFIKKWFSRKGENPGDAATIASQLRLNELELYTQTERFIFELLQNADDMPTEGKKVNVKMELFGDYFLFLHDGKFFDRNDVQAIADAAQSTKSRDKTKTGYKGIGFKSVFTDSTRVFIKSFDYSFKFDKLHPVYQNFWELYEGYLNKLSSTAQQDFKREYAGQEERYTQIERIPWQIKPIWVERTEFPDALKKSDFWGNQTVAIALEIGQATFAEKQYDQKIGNLLSEPRFLLFLRNVTSVSYKHNDHSSTLALQREGPQFNILLNNNHHSTYTKWEAEITISNESFAAAGLHFQKRALQEGKYEFVAEDGQQIKNIPEKLSILDRTTLTFACKIQAEKIQRVHKEEAILFNYLPTSDKRFAFPFLVNGDFITKTDREFILHENLWNQYLFYNIGYSHVKWLSKLSENSRFQSSYINLLVSELKDDTHQSEGEINAAFNRGLCKAVAEVPFIRTQTGSVVVSAEIILDETELANVLGATLFYDLTGTSKKLPETRIKAPILRRDFLAIERFSVEHLANLLAQEESVALFANAITTFSEQQYNTFLLWIDVHCEENAASFAPLLPTLPFLRFDSQILCWSAIVDQDDYLLLDNRTDSLRAELAALSFSLSAVSIDLFPAIKLALQVDDTYLDTDALLYAKVSARCNQHKLEPEQKAKLFTFFAGLKQVGKEKYARTLRLFADESGVCRPLDKLLSRNVDGLPVWLAAYKITESEFGLLPPAASEYLVKATNLFSQLLCDLAVLADCTKGLDSRHVSEWIEHLLTWRNKEDPKTSESGWANLPWLYTNEEHRFKAAAQIWDHNALDKFPAQAVIESLTGWLIPHPACRPLVKQFDLRLKLDKLTDTLEPADILLTESNVRLLLSFLIESGESQFLTKFQLVAGNEGFQIKALPAGQRLYIADESLSAYVNTSSVVAKLVKLPETFVTIIGIEKLGVLTDRVLVGWLVNTDAKLALTPFVSASSDLDLHEQFVSRVKLALRSDIPYERMALESQFVRLADQVHRRKEDDAAKAFSETVRANTSLNDDSLDKWRVNDRVRIGKKETGFYSEFRLSELLPEKYKGVSDVVNQLVEKFSDSKPFVRNELLASKELSTSEVAQELRKIAYLSPLQVVFRQMQAKAENFTNTLQGFKTFHQFLAEDEKFQELTEACVAYLTILEEKEFDESYIDFNLYKYVDTSVRLNEAEALPGYLATWADSQEKIKFLSKLKLMGRLNEVSCFNGPDSSVVKLRKAMLTGKADDTWETYFMSIKKQKLLVENTTLWLAKQPNEVINRNLSAIKSLLNETVTLGWTETHILVANEVTDETRNYQLKKWSGEPVYFIRDDWADHSSSILQAIHKKGGWLIDGSTPDRIRLRVKPIDKAFESVIRPNLIELCRPFNADYYLSWTSQAEYPVLIYERGQFLPYEIWYNGEYIAEDTTSHQVHYLAGKTIFLTKSAIDEFPLERPEGIAYSVIEPLVKLKYTGASKPTDNDETETDYNSGTDKIKQGQELSKEDQKNWHAEAVKRSKDHLNEEGYDFTVCTEKPESFSYKYDSHVKAPNGEYVNVFYRSAKGGLLYLNPGLWRKLAGSNNVLVVIYEDGKPRVFTSQETLLEEEYNPYMLYRVRNDKEVASVNAVAEQLEDGTGHLLFVTGPAYYEHLYDMLKPQAGDSPMEETSTGVTNLW